MPDTKLIASIFLSAVDTSLSEQKLVPKKKKKATVEKKAAPVPTAVAKPQVVPAPKADDGWVAVKNGKKKGVPLVPSSNPIASSSKVNHKKKNGALLVPSSGVVSSSKVTKKDTLATNAFYLPKELEKRLHQAPSTSTSTSNKEAEVAVAKDTVVVPPQLTKSQRKNQLRAQKRAKIRAEKEKAALLLKRAQDLSPLVQFEAKKAFKPKAASKPKQKETQDTESQSGDTMITAAISEDGATVATPPSSEDCPLLSLPYDIILNGIMSFLRPEEMCKLGACSRYAKHVSEAGFLWQTMFKQRFPGSQLSPQSMEEWKLAYQLSLTKVVDRLRCGTTQKTFMEDVLGVGVDFTANPKTGSVDYIELSQDLLSETAFSKHKVRKDVFGNSFTLFLPLYFSAEHFKRALPQVQKTIAHLARNRKSTFQRFHPFMILDVLPKIVTTFVVLLSDNGISASRKTYQGLIRIHRLFLALAHHYPEVKAEALRRLKLFASSEQQRTKKMVPNLGAILPLLMIVDEEVCGFPQVRAAYVSETFDRMVLWTCKKFPQLERTHGKVSEKVESEAEAASRVELTFEASHVNLRLMMFHVYFLRSCSYGTTWQRANRYDRFFGQPEPIEMDADADEDENVDQNEIEGSPVASPKANESPSSDSTIQFSHFREQINYIMTVNSWQKFLAFVGLPCPSSKAEMARRLRVHVQNSRQKKYHTAGMDFSRIQASGTSRILSKGQEYSASSDLRRVVFSDNWGFEGGTKYLDATCLLYKGNERLETVDYHCTVSRCGAVQHSGDMMTETTGTHTIDLDLDVLNKEVTSCVFVLSAWAGATLADIKFPRVSFSNADTDAVLCTYDLDSQDKVDYLTSVIMCRLYRVSGSSVSGSSAWHVQAIGDAHRGAADDYGPIYSAVAKLL